MRSYQLASVAFFNAEAFSLINRVTVSSMPCPVKLIAATRWLESMIAKKGIDVTPNLVAISLKGWFSGMDFALRF